MLEADGYFIMPLRQQSQTSVNLLVFYSFSCANSISFVFYIYLLSSVLKTCYKCFLNFIDCKGIYSAAISFHFSSSLLFYAYALGPSNTLRILQLNPLHPYPLHPWLHHRELCSLSWHVLKLHLSMGPFLLKLEEQLLILPSLTFRA